MFKLIQSTNKLIRNPSNPKLRKFNGNVKNFKITPSVQFNSVRTMISMVAAQIVETLNPGKILLNNRIIKTLTTK